MAHRFGAGAAMVAVLAVSVAGPAMANGWMESRPWQFDTSADKANKAAVADMIERKKGGYYDGFSTTVNNYNTTNVGTQLNCNNLADATANVAQNGQTANSPNVDNEAVIDSNANGNVADNATGGKFGPGIGNDQDNSGNVGSNVDDSTTSSTSGPITTGDSDQVLNNDQFNSGNQYASVDGTACDFGGASIKGSVMGVGGPLN